MWTLLAAWMGCGLIEPQGSVAAPVDPPDLPTVHSKKVVSSPYHIDGLYASMRGPFGFDDVWLEQTESPELLWIVGYRTTVISADSAAPLSQEFMCHANLDFDTRAPTAEAPSASARIAYRSTAVTRSDSLVPAIRSTPKAGLRSLPPAGVSDDRYPSG